MNFLRNLTPVQRQVTELTSAVIMPIVDMEFHDQAHMFCELSILAYFDLAGATEWGTKMGFTRITQTAIPNDLTVTIFSNEEDIVIAFRGTSNLTNLTEDLDCNLRTDGMLPGKAHDGFLKSFDRIWTKLLPCIDAKHHRVWATGHSLGGALASIAAVRSARREGARIDGLFTFGQPRIGNGEYVSGVGIDCYRWVNNLDLIPAVPPVSMGYVHFGKEYFIDRTGRVRPRTFLNSFRRLLNRLSMTAKVIDDHEIVNYRAAILRSNQESAHGQR